MKLTQAELGVVALIIGYIAFFTHPPPSHIADFLSTPVGKIIGLVGVLYVAVYQSLIVGVFLAIAYIMTAGPVTEYLDPKEQAPKKEEPAQPTSKGVPPPEVKNALSSLLKAQTGPAFKGDNRLPTAAQKKGVAAAPAPKTAAPPKPSAPTTGEHVASF
jgi:cell division protein FtsN